MYWCITDAEGTGGADLQRKLDLLNGALDAERAEQARRQFQYVAHCEYSYYIICINKNEDHLLHPVTSNLTFVNGVGFF